MINITRSLMRLGKIPKRRVFYFSKKKQQEEGNAIFNFVKDAWRQTFPKEEDQIRRKYQKVKEQKRYTQQELQNMQENIHEYQRTSLVETQQKAQEIKKGFKVSNMIPQSVKSKIKETESYKQYSEFRENLKEYVNTSDTVAVNLGNKAYNVVTQPSSAAKATETLRRYDKDFSIMELQKQSTFIFRDAYQYLLQQNVEELQKLCGEQALDYFKSLVKINAIKKVKPMFTQILNHSNSSMKQTVIRGQDTLPSFIFEMKLMQIYCMVDYEGKIVDGDEERIMSSTYHFSLSYSGQNIAELGHPWEITEVRKVDEVKLLV